MSSNTVRVTHPREVQRRIEDRVHSMMMIEAVSSLEKKVRTLWGLNPLSDPTGLVYETGKRIQRGEIRIRVSGCERTHSMAALFLF